MSKEKSVRRRHVYYISGFDPNGPARYQKLYSDGARKQAALTGVEIEVGARVKVDSTTALWEIFYQAGGAATGVKTTYVFLRWDDIVRKFWWHKNWRQLPDLCVTSWHFLSTGALWRLFRQRWQPFISVFAPFLLVVSFLPGALGLFMAWRNLGFCWMAGLPMARAGMVCFFMTGLGLFWAFWARRRWHEQWILRAYSFIRRVATGQVPELDTRMNLMAEMMCRQILAGEDDEILVVGHCVGSILAISVLAKAFRMDPLLAQRGVDVGLMTLGHCTPLLSNLPGGEVFRGDLAFLGRRNDFRWVDFSDPLDDYGFAGVEPVLAGGFDGGVWGHPLMLSPEVGQVFEGGVGLKGGLSAFEVHHQYLCASRSGHFYDYFAVTGGGGFFRGRFWGA